MQQEVDSFAVSLFRNSEFLNSGTAMLSNKRPSISTFHPIPKAGLFNVHWSVLEMFVNTNYSFKSFTYFSGLLLTFDIISIRTGDIQYNLYNYQDGGNENDCTYM